MDQEPQIFRHSGKLGDIVYSLPAVRAVGGGDLFVRAPSPYGLDVSQAAALLPLLRAQPYVRSAEIWAGEPYTFDLDAFRSFGPTDRTLAEAHYAALGASGFSPEEAWLTLPPRRGSPKAIFARSTSRRGVPGFWKEIYTQLGGSAVFVGSVTEHQAFCHEVGPIEYLLANDLLELAALIAGAPLFVGNQSCPFAIAEGLKVPVILEVDAGARNCIYRRQGALHVGSDSTLRKICAHVNKWMAKRENTGSSTVEKDFKSAAPDIGPANICGSPCGFGNIAEFSETERFLLDRVRPGQRSILVLGSGAAAMGSALKRSDPTRIVWAIDPDRDEKQREHVLDRLYTGRLEQLIPMPLPTGAFDCALISDSLEQYCDVQAFFSSLNDHLLPAGTVVGHAPNAAHWSNISRLLTGAFDSQAKANAVSFDLLEQTLWDSGLAVRHRHDWSWSDATAVEVLMQAAATLGCRKTDAERRLVAFHVGFEAVLQPDPTAPENRRRLLGPHVGQLRPAVRRCSVVIVTFNSGETIEECLDALLPTLSNDDEVIVIDNASADGTLAAIERRRGLDPRLSVNANTENKGFAAACNQGILGSAGEAIVLLNPDTVVVPGWVEGLLGPLQSARVGAVGPVCDRVSGDQFVRFHLPDEAEHVPLEDLGRVVGAANRGRYTPTKLLIGFCLAIARDTLNQVGLLDEAMFLGSEDVELSWRLRTLGYELVIAKGVLVRHETGRSFASLDPSVAERYRRASDRALLDKLSNYYSAEVRLNSRVIWGNEIFRHMFEEPST